MEKVEKRHKVYISYHHTDADSHYQQLFMQNTLLVEKVLASREKNFANISPNLNIERTKQLVRERILRDTTVTVVLVGKDTWKRKHIDWEISASISDDSFVSRSGLLGILLPSHPDYTKNSIDPFTIPARLHDNIEHGYAKIYKWQDDPLLIQEWIHQSFMNRHKFPPYNLRPEMTENRIAGNSWRN